MTAGQRRNTAATKMVTIANIIARATSHAIGLTDHSTIQPQTPSTGRRGERSGRCFSEKAMARVSLGPPPQMRSRKEEVLVAITRLNNYEGCHGAVTIHCLLVRVTSRSVQFVAIGAFAMKHCSSVTAAQQFLTDTASTLVAHIQHK